MEHEQAIDGLDRDIQQLKIDFERFFSGNLAVPPEPSREKIREKLRRLRSAPSRSLVDQFRLNTLEARFNTLSELFNRRLREREEGWSGPRPAAPDSAPEFDPLAGIVVSDRPHQEAVRALYAGLYGDAATATTDFRRFETYFLSQLSIIRDKTGCRRIQFRVATEGGKPKLKAKPLSRPGSAGEQDSERRPS